MYKVTRNAQGVVIKDWNDKLIYNAPSGAIVLYRDNAGHITTTKVTDLTDEQILVALANAVTLPL